MGKTCCFTGYRPEKLAFLEEENSESYRRLYALLTELIREAVDSGCDHFISGFAKGVDLMAAEIVIGLKREGLAVSLEAALPAMNQTEGWDDFSRGVYYTLLDAADKRVCVDTKMTRYSALRRNEYMVRKADLVIAVFDGKKGGTSHTVRLAEAKKRDLWIVDPNDFSVTRQDSLF